MTHLQSINQFVLRNPASVCLLMPWFLVMLPLTFVLPADAVNWAWARALANEMAGWVPMIDRMSAVAKEPQRTRFLLSCLWASGPLWALVAAICGVRTLKAGIHAQKALSFSFFIGAFMFYGGMLLVLRSVKPRPWKNVDLFGYLFTDGPGLFFAGWFAITCMFVVIGLMAALPLSRLFGCKFPMPGGGTAR